MTRNLIICCDGTGNEYGPRNTNVVHAYEATARDHRQLGFYDPGVGTFSFLGIPLARSFCSLLGKAFGLGLRQNLADAYTFLMAHYRPGDRIFLFGFSRGAFTARALAGMLHKCGLLRSEHENLVEYALRIYTGRGNKRVARGFKATFAEPCPVHFVGVWDTVASLGWFLGRKFNNARLNPEVANGFHALAIDEQRREFQAVLWDETAREPGQVIEQVWFPGVHSDVGGSYDDRGLADTALLWMLGKARACGLHLRADWQQRIAAGRRDKERSFQASVGFKPDPLARLHESRVKAWRLSRPTPRRIPEGSRLHSSVYLRMRSREDYFPPLPIRFEWSTDRSVPEPVEQERSAA